MSRIPVLSRNEMDAEQQKVYDAIVATTGRVGRGPSVGYAYSPGYYCSYAPRPYYSCWRGRYRYRVC